MNKRINFEDDIFIIMMRIRMIRDTISLNADPELFLEKTLDDICHVDQILRLLLGNLERNPRLIEREELLEQFSDAEEQFNQILTEMLDNSGNFSIRGLTSLVEKVTAFRANSIERRKTAEILHPSEDSISSSIYVSSDEITELLKR